ncbi:MAG: hypothetical protein M1839_002841 [Geoglossum umbratile]|nr:MAG: hypothetical protein M1839_002841 [Geoglossum umbratile]
MPPPRPLAPWLHQLSPPIRELRRIRATSRNRRDSRTRAAHPILLGRAIFADMIFNRVAALALLSSLASTSTLSLRSPNPLSQSEIFPRDANADNLCPTTATTCGGRKVALVIDSSGSNTVTDPHNFRVEAGKEIAQRLVSTTEASGKVKADQVTVVDFDDSATVVYPMGDPSGANFTKIDSSGGTYIADGVREGVGQITGSSGGLAKDASGMVVLTDGEDSNQAELISEITKAGGLGIRVHFGFLDPSGLGTSRPSLLSAILGTGGIYSTISSAEAQKNFVNLVYLQGLTKQDNPNPNSTTGLLPGLTVARLIDSSQPPVKFTYSALSGEKLNFTVSSLSNQILTCSLRSGKKEVASATTSSFGGKALMSYESSKNDMLSLEVKATSGQGVMQVQPKTNMPNATRPLITSAAAMSGGKPSPFTLVGMSVICLVFAGTIVLG